MEDREEFILCDVSCMFAFIMNSTKVLGTLAHTYANEHVCIFN